MNGARFFGMLSLAKRAGQVKSGTFLSEKAVVSRKAKLLILPEEAHSRTVRELMEKAQRAGIPCVSCGTREELGNALGEEERSCAVITDEGFASAVRRIADQE